MRAQARKESDILGKLEIWKKELRELESMEGSISGMEGSMNDKVKTTAVKRILVGSIKVYMRQREEDYVGRDDDDDEIPYAKYVNILKKHLARRAFEGQDVVMGGQ